MFFFDPSQDYEGDGETAGIEQQELNEKKDEESSASSLKLFTHCLRRYNLHEREEKRLEKMLEVYEDVITRRRTEEEEEEDLTSADKQSKSSSSTTSPPSRKSLADFLGDGPAMHRWESLQQLLSRSVIDAGSLSLPPSSLSLSPFSSSSPGSSISPHRKRRLHRQDEQIMRAMLDAMSKSDRQNGIGKYCCKSQQRRRRDEELLAMLSTRPEEKRENNVLQETKVASDHHQDNPNTGIQNVFGLVGGGGGGGGESGGESERGTMQNLLLSEQSSEALFHRGLMVCRHFFGISKFATVAIYGAKKERKEKTLLRFQWSTLEEMAHEVSGMLNPQFPHRVLKHRQRIMNLLDIIYNSSYELMGMVEQI